MGLVLYGQDAGMVLRTSVTYRTQRNNPQLTDEQRQMADQLAARRRRPIRRGKYGDAMRAYYHGLAVMRGVPWTPANEVRVFVAGASRSCGGGAGQTGHGHADAALHQRACGAKLTASVFLVPLKKDGAAEKSLGAARAGSRRAALLHESRRAPDAAGDYTIEVRLTPEGKRPAPAGAVKTLPVHVEPLAGAAQRLRDRLAKAGKKDSPALPTAEYALALYERADAARSTRPCTTSRGIRKANEILDASDAGSDPFAGKHGDFRKAYRSAVDQTLQPYRLLIPERLQRVQAERAGDRAARNGRRRKQHVRFLRRHAQARGRAAA